MGLVLQFQSLPPSRRHNFSQLPGQSGPAKGKTADIIIFPGVRRERGLTKKSKLYPPEPCQAGKWPAE